MRDLPFLCSLPVPAVLPPPVQSADPFVLCIIHCFVCRSVSSPKKGRRADPSVSSPKQGHGAMGICDFDLGLRDKYKGFKVWCRKMENGGLLWGWVWCGNVAWCGGGVDMERWAGVRLG
eukprot:217406-Chlamydomonas_euryale.AAC.1